MHQMLKFIGPFSSVIVNQWDSIFLWARQRQEEPILVRGTDSPAAKTAAPLIFVEATIRGGEYRHSGITLDQKISNET